MRNEQIFSRRKFISGVAVAVAKVVEGTVARQGGRKAPASSVYVRDPDGNLLEFMIYG